MTRKDDETTKEIQRPSSSRTKINQELGKILAEMVFIPPNPRGSDRFRRVLPGKKKALARKVITPRPTVHNKSSPNNCMKTEPTTIITCNPPMEVVYNTALPAVATQKDPLPAEAAEERRKVSIYFISLSLNLFLAITYHTPHFFQWFHTYIHHSKCP